MEINVCALWRDSESTMDNTLNALDKLILLPEFKFNFYFYENDSTDNTRQKLQTWLKDKSGQLLYEDPGFPKFGSVPDLHRLILLSYYRNKVKGLNLSENAKYTLLIDSDVMFDNVDFKDLLEKIEKLGAAMVVANTREYQIKDLMLDQSSDSFYDVFALRDKYNHKGLYFTDCPFLLKEDRDEWTNNNPVLINAGFGGFSLIRTDVLKHCNWSTVGHSEHINFCSEVSKFGHIFMIPSCKPKTAANLESISLEKCSEVAKNQIEQMQQFNNIFYTSLSPSLKA